MLHGPEQREALLSIHTAPEETENETNTGHFRFAFEQISVREMVFFSQAAGPTFGKDPFSKLTFAVQTKTKSRHFQIIPV